MDKRLLDLLVCPVCKGPLRMASGAASGAASVELICRADRLAFAVREGVPHMIPEEARSLGADDALLRR